MTGKIYSTVHPDLPKIVLMRRYGIATLIKFLFLEDKVVRIEFCVADCVETDARMWHYFFFFVLLSLFGVSFFRTPCAVYIDSLCKRAFSHVFVASLNFVASFSTSQIHFQTSDLSNPLWTKIHRITDLRDLKTDRCITNPTRSFGRRMRNWSFCPAVLNFKQVGNSYTAGTPTPRLCPVVQ